MLPEARRPRDPRDVIAGGPRDERPGQTEASKAAPKSTPNDSVFPAAEGLPAPHEWVYQAESALPKLTIRTLTPN